MNADLRFGEKVLTSKGKRLELTPGGERHRRWHRADHNGVVVFLDGSGLLHLTDTTGKLPAIALMLADGDTACWCSEGACGLPLGPNMRIKLFGDEPVLAPSCSKPTVALM